MSDEIEKLTCEKCGLKCVPANLRKTINDPVICMGCRLSKYLKEQKIMDEGSILDVSMHDIDTKMEGKKIRFECIIQGLGDKKTYYKKAAFECKKCNAVLSVLPDDIYETEVPKCEQCKIFMTLVPSSSDSSFIRYAKLEEPMEKKKLENPQRYTALIKDDFASKVSHGQRWMVTAIFKSVMEGKRKYNDIVLDIVDMISTDICKEELPNEKELEWLLEEAKKPDFLNKVVESYTNKISLFDPKLSMLLSRVRGDFIPNVIKRDDIHVFFMGNPSVAKSELLQFGHEITPKSILMDCGNAGKTGIRGGIETLSDGSHIFVAGTASLANNSTLFMDEFDKLAKEDIPSLYRIMEQQEMEYDKIIHVRQPTDTTIIASANPKNGYYDKGLTLQQNFNIPFTLQTRFDLIWMIKSIESEDQLKKIAGQAKSSYKWEPFMTKEQMMRYLNHASKIHPILPDEVADKIHDFWVKAKLISLKQEDGIKIEPRHLHGIIRITFAFAKLRLHETVSEEDADEAIAIFKRSLKSLGQDLDTGELTQTYLRKTHKQLQSDIFMNAVNELAAKNPDGVIEPSELIEMLIKSTKYNDEEAKHKCEFEAQRAEIIVNAVGQKYKISK